MKLYRVSIDIPEAKLGTVIGCLAGEVQNWRVEPIASSQSTEVPSKVQSEVRKSKKFNVLPDRKRGVDFVLDELKKGDGLTSNEVGAKFQKYGMSHNGGSARLSDLMKLGLVEIRKNPSGGASLYYLTEAGRSHQGPVLRK